jgi:hypothetical protein
MSWWSRRSARLFRSSELRKARRWQPVGVREVRLLELIGRAFTALWIAWLAAAVVAFVTYLSGLLSAVAALAVGLTLAVVFMAIGLLTKE